LAQPSQNNWDNLKELAPGQKIEVVDMNLKSVKGAFLSLSTDSISLNSGKQEVAVQRADVMRVSLRDSSKLRRNMLIGAGTAGGAVLTIGLLANAPASNEGTGCAGCVVGFAAAAAGGGAGLGAIPGNRTVYRIKK
jgi:hypothetical protein